MTFARPPAPGVADRIAGYFARPPFGGPPMAQQAATPQTPAGYQLLDMVRTVQQGDAPASGGLITATFPEVNPEQLWLVDRMAVYCTSSTATVAFVYIGRPAAQDVADGTIAGNLDFADNNSPLLVPGSRGLVVRWEGASDGATALAVVQYRLMG